MKSKIFLSLICFAALSLGVHAAETAGSTPASNRPKITDNSSASAEATSSKQQNTDDPKAKQEAAATDKEAAATDTKAAATDTKAAATNTKAAATDKETAATNTMSTNHIAAQKQVAYGPQMNILATLVFQEKKQIS